MSCRNSTLNLQKDKATGNDQSPTLRSSFPSRNQHLG